ncbi:MAG: sigma-70 family RNA polymerase sigma factor [Bryobacteraceae bacterium]|nr:sigma-70 family RNA polymerase sigma factor [Bryobacteraceae bacterium]
MLRDSIQLKRFEQVVLPHLDAALQLARWLTRNEEDARDIVQESYLRALRFFGSFHGEDARVWLLKIVRNTCYSWIKQNRPWELAASFDEVMHSGAAADLTPESLVLEKAERVTLLYGLGQLRVEWREALVLREVEGLSYRQIACITSVPIGTVMSRLYRARTRLQELVRSEGDRRSAGVRES